MPETTTETITTTEPATGATDPSTSETTTTDETKDWKAEAEKWQGLARKHEDRAKTNASAAKELEQLRQSSMSDQEKAVAQAKAEGRTEAQKEAAAKVAEAELRAAAAGRLNDQQLASLLEGVDVAKFIDDVGDVDRDKVTKFVDGIAPKPDETTGSAWPDLGQGARGGAGAGSADPLLAHVKQIAGTG